MLSKHLSTQDPLKESKKLSFLHLDGEKLYFLQTRPEEGGRSLLLDLDENEITPAPYNVKTRVNTYGGKCFTISDGTLYFFSDHDKTLYKKTKENTFIKLYHQKNVFFADLDLCKKTNKLYGVMQHQLEGGQKSSIFSFDLIKNELALLHSSQDFYASPKVSPCGQFLAFISWNNPDMPWDKTALWRLHLDNGAEKIYEENVSTSHLIWLKDSSLIFNSEKSGYWNLFVYKNGKTEQLTSEKIEFGSAHWIYGTSRFCLYGEDHIVLIGTQRAQESLYLLDLKSLTLTSLPLPFSSLSEIYSVATDLYFIASSEKKDPSIYQFDTSSKKLSSLITSHTTPFSYCCQTLSLNLGIGASSDVFCYFPEEKKAHYPLLLKVHSGPTAHVTKRCGSDIAYFTSRGFVYAEFNYRGSTGYGKDFRESLYGEWGKFDVEDTITCTQALCKALPIDKNQLFLKGSSAGGLTTLLVLCQSSIFKAGVCYYPVTDLCQMQSHTHPFEAFYFEKLIGPYPQMKKMYEERSPFHLDLATSPSILFFQGKLDPVTPYTQTKLFYNKLKEHNCDVDLVLFEDEGHGFRKQETLSVCYAKELHFYHEKM